jgi:hypothetical protein
MRREDTVTKLEHQFFFFLTKADLTRDHFPICKTVIIPRCRHLQSNTIIYNVPYTYIERTPRETRIFVFVDLLSRHCTENKL